MAKLRGSVLGTFIGKVGTIVGTKRFKDNIVRAYQGTVRNPRTDEQVIQREKFTFLSQLAATSSKALAIGLKKQATTQYMSPENLFIRMNMPTMAQSTMEELKCEYSQLRFSKGKTQMPSVKTPTFENSLTAEVPLTNNSEEGNEHAMATDDIYLVALQPDSGQIILSTPEKRNAASIKVKTPNTWSGVKIHLYLFAVSSSKKYQKVASNTLYAGSGTIL